MEAWTLDETHRAKRHQGMQFDAQTDPMLAFDAWMNEAKQNAAIREPSAMSVATVDKKGQVHTRVVLCRGWSDGGFTFFTNYHSQKGHDLDQSPSIGAVFYWDPMFRQVKISGRAEKTSRQVSVDYWNARPRANQLSQYVSKQSEELPTRELLDQAWADAENKFLNQPIPCPEHWGGYRIEPSEIEFWLGQTGRLHDRWVYRKNQTGPWTFRRLYP